MAYTRLEKDGPVAVLWLDRTEAKNRLNKAFLTEITEHVQSLDPATAALILTAPGDDVFSAGYDIDEIPAGKSLEELKQFEDENPIWRAGGAIAAAPFPTICLVNGKLYGGAMELFLSCDVRWGADHSEYCLPPARLGVMYEPMGLWRLVDAVGYGNACEMVFTAAVVPAQRAMEMRLINRVVAKEQLQEEGLKLAHKMSKLAPLTLRNSKKVLQVLQRRTALSAEQDAELKVLCIACFQSEDVVEGRAAFLEKRKPEFKGR